jgi:hypothetical protein
MDSLSQNEHDFGMGALVEDFKRILEKQKDVEANVNASISWLQAQPDLWARCTLYNIQNMGYDPKNAYSRKVSQFFWNHHSLEQDSLRD